MILDYFVFFFNLVFLIFTHLVRFLFSIQNHKSNGCLLVKTWFVALLKNKVLMYENFYSTIKINFVLNLQIKEILSKIFLYKKVPKFNKRKVQIHIEFKRNKIKKKQKVESGSKD